MVSSGVIVRAISKRQATETRLPRAEEDPAERKRVLNVLAQRRYRRRKRQRMEELERKAAAAATHSSSQAETYTDSPRALSYSEDRRCSIATSISSLDQSSSQSHIPPEIIFTNDGGPDSTFNSITLLPNQSGIPSTTTQQTHASAQPRPIDVHNFLPFSPIVEINVLQACALIVRRLGLESVYWDLTSNSPFVMSAPTDHSHLPRDLRPTMRQMTIDHHPLIDVLPWPAVRDKLVMIFAQPNDYRPPSARSPMALTNLVYDLEDSLEGARVMSNNPYSAENWEIGQKVFENWWWAFNKTIIDDSNKKRVDRGAAPLYIPQFDPSVM